MEFARVQLGLAVGVTQQIAPRVSVEVDYIRRSWGNLTAEVNRAWTPADFDTFLYTVPSGSDGCLAAAGTT